MRLVLVLEWEGEVFTLRGIKEADVLIDETGNLVVILILAFELIAALAAQFVGNLYDYPTQVFVYFHIFSNSGQAIAPAR